LKLQAPPAEQRIRAALADEPGLSVRSLAERAGVSQSAASKWRRVIRGEGERGDTQQRAAQ
jgi:transposase-like protein